MDNFINKSTIYSPSPEYILTERYDSFSTGEGARG